MQRESRYRCSFFAQRPADDAQPAAVGHAQDCRAAVSAGMYPHGCGYAITPTGSFRTTVYIPGWVTVPLGEMYNPVFFIRTTYAIHGDTYVPVNPVSHGCVRIPMDIAAFFHKMVKTPARRYTSTGKPSTARPGCRARAGLAAWPIVAAAYLSPVTAVPAGRARRKRPGPAARSPPPLRGCRRATGR
jgi:hypothetical protein